jgi:uncharacterized protein (DUF736 family)
MPGKWTPERRAQFAADMAARRAKAQQQKQTPQDKQVDEPIHAAPDVQPAADTPPEPSKADSPQLLTFTPEQLQTLVAALTGGKADQAVPQAFSSLGQHQTNAQGQVIGTIEKFPISAGYYPDPVEEVTRYFDDTPKYRRLAFSENYYLTWEWDAKPYETKFGTHIQEPTFHLTLYANLFDEDGDETDKFHIVQTFHFNEDETTALEVATELGFDANHDNMRAVMDLARVERIKRWLLNVFTPEKNYDLNQFYSEEAIGGQVVKVITKSNVKGFGNKTPKIDIEELQ